MSRFATGDALGVGVGTGDASVLLPPGDGLTASPAGVAGAAAVAAGIAETGGAGDDAAVCACCLEHAAAARSTHAAANERSRREATSSSPVESPLAPRFARWESVAWSGSRGGMAVLGPLSKPPKATSLWTGSTAPKSFRKAARVKVIDTVDELEALYGIPLETSIVKEVGRVTPEYRALIEASPFAALATSGPEGLDCSPRGDLPEFVRVHDETTLLLPDRRGNNRIDSLRNIVRDPRVALLFLIPGSGTTLRVNGRAALTADPELLASFAVEGKQPRCVVAIDVESVYFQCARAIVRSQLWNAAKHVDPARLPTPGRILALLSEERVGGSEYDDTWQERARRTLW
jgi:PPOX class probable FMN-dependent enzyme